ncbi:hypothetical protein [Paracraurococcus ruber]|uniref:Transposase n=1 Tax=Paracraurococcus ruber TaxID=77675 RepID=A0ABS1D2M2_9PROT|nr:hypothetical protein [Paracraurococcus ruber]MBK1660753.1 hypothetical protein [Paracraurococcus ruber]TDG27150.1 hypothetical protein E2C05_23915 [Paracraurococcus ruber]
MRRRKKAPPLSIERAGDGVPIVNVIRVPDDPSMVRFICPHCRAKHGYSALGVVLGKLAYRAVRCHVPDGPFAEYGHYLRLIDYKGTEAKR